MAHEPAADQPSSTSHAEVWHAMPRFERAAVAAFLAFAVVSLVLGAVVGISTTQTDGAVSLGLYLFVGSVGAVVCCILAAELFYAQARILEDRATQALIQGGTRGD